MLVDIRLGKTTGSRCWPIAARQQPDVAVVMITGYGTVESAVEAIRLGAFDFLTKPLLDEELLLAIGRALDQRKVLEENRCSRPSSTCASAWRTSSATTTAC